MRYAKSGMKKKTTSARNYLITPLEWAIRESHTKVKVTAWIPECVCILQRINDEFLKGQTLGDVEFATAKPKARQKNFSKNTPTEIPSYICKRVRTPAVHVYLYSRAKHRQGFRSRAPFLPAAWPKSNTPIQCAYRKGNEKVYAGMR